ncbi:MAG TPA: HAMP domain-containing sensor histidine kinase [Ktedonobacteraceae bacterium]|nr:HAMP domain-containing sensor histidine kinase [Ktedonobacteraceae bacterium]
MRMTQTTGTDTGQQGQRLKSMSLEQKSDLRQRYKAKTPRWRHPFVGYIASIPLVILGIYATLSMQKMLGQLYLSGSLMVLAVLFTALFWGVGPALLAIALSTLALDYFTLPSTGILSITSWQGLFQLFPFIITGLIIALIVAQRERARLDSIAAEQELQSYAQELEEVNQKLKDANQMKDRFLSIASHELKTPITSIRGQAQLMLRRLSKQSQLSPEMATINTTLEKINAQTDRLTTLINDLLDVSSIRTGKLALRKQPCDIRELCRQVVDDQRLLTDRSILLDMPLEPIEVQADGDRLSQVLVNLISNAIKYSPEKSAVEVCVGRVGNNVRIKVRDHGRGIAKNQIEHIFDTFYRTPEAEKSSQRGLGLGLAISKDIVERHNGRIWCESEPKKGSTFYVELPLG